MKMNLWWLLGAKESSPESRKKLGVVALLYFIQGAGDRFILRSKAAVDLLVISMIVEIWN